MERKVLAKWQNIEHYFVLDEDTQGFKYTKLIKGKLKTDENNHDTLGRQPMTRKGWRQDINKKTTHVAM